MIRKLYRPMRGIALVPLVLLAACSVGPDYKRPAAPMAETFKPQVGAQDVWQVGQPSDHAPRGKWWEMFKDPDLNALMEQIDVANQSLKAAEARYRQALALSQSARADLFPSVNANVSSTRARAASRSAGSSPVTTSDSASLGASWELDLWGRVRRQNEASQSSLEASAGDVEAARLSLQAELATNYFQLRVNDAQKQLFEDTIAAYERSLMMTKNRYAAGVVARVDVVQAETQLKSAQAQAIDLGVQRAQFENAIAVLIGKPASSFSLPAKNWTGTLPTFPTGQPSTLLERRPDVAAAERRMAAANAQIGVARAAYFPTFSLSGNVGYSSPGWDKWISAPNRFWSLGPSMALSVLDFGKRSALERQAEASYDQTVATYRDTVLGAFEDVENNLAALRIYAQEAQVQEEAVRAARESVTLTTNQYKAGIVTYLNVVTAQTAQLSNERTAVGLLGRRLSSTIGLIRALGGKW